MSTSSQSQEHSQKQIGTLPKSALFPRQQRPDGYYFHAADDWGLAATSVFDDPEQNYSSTFVWGECFGIENGGRCATVQKRIVRDSAGRSPP